MDGLVKQLPKTTLSTITYSREIEANLKTQAVDQNQDYLSKSSYKSAYCYPIKELNRWAAEHNSIIVWDLSHAVGAVPIDFKGQKQK